VQQTNVRTSERSQKQLFPSIHIQEDPERAKCRERVRGWGPPQSTPNLQKAGLGAKRWGGKHHPNVSKATFSKKKEKKHRKERNRK